MKKVVIFGATSLARQVYVYLTENSTYKIAAFTVTKEYLVEEKFMGLEVVPFERIEKTHPPEKLSMFVAIGYKRVNRGRAEIYYNCLNKGYALISYVSSKTAHWGHTEIGDNTFIYGNGAIHPFVKIGNDVIIGSATIGHDSIIDDHCYISSHAMISGNVRIGRYCFIGANATIKDGVTIAPECVIGAGAIILKDTKGGGVYPGQNAEMADITNSELKSFQ